MKLNGKFIVKAVAAVIMTSVGISSAFAHIESGVVMKGVDKVKQIRVNCSQGRDRLVANIRGGKPKRVFSATLKVQKLPVTDADPMLVLTDSVVGDSIKSASKALIQGPGDYLLTVGKAKRKPNQKNGVTNLPMTYEIELHCQNSSGEHTEGDTVVTD
ncbi:MAG: hypothetical protein ACK443_10205 [Methylococcaceae bacterium]|jgi:hypothetical protein